MNTKSLAKTVLASLLGTACTATSLQALADATSPAANKHNTAATKNQCAGMNLKNIPKERCFGIAKKGKNECGTNKHACANQAASNNEACEWIYVLKGNCERITGGQVDEPKQCEQSSGEDEDTD